MYWSTNQIDVGLSMGPSAWRVSARGVAAMLEPVRGMSLKGLGFGFRAILDLPSTL